MIALPVMIWIGASVLVAMLFGAFAQAGGR